MREFLLRIPVTVEFETKGGKKKVIVCPAYTDVHAVILGSWTKRKGTYVTVYDEKGYIYLKYYRWGFFALAKLALQREKKK